MKLLETLINEADKAFNDYSNKTKTRSLEHSGLYINPERMGKGNSKLVNINIFDLPAVKSCLNCSSCKDTCYALKAEVQYPDTRIMRLTNLFLAKSHMSVLRNLLINQLWKTKFSTVRLHSSGDFYSQKYVDMWESIISMFPKINFYAYSKVERILDFGSIEKLGNFNLIHSFIDGQLNYGSIDYCNELNKKYDTFICPVTLHTKEDIKCGGECSYCVTGKNVCFVQH